MPSLGLYAVAGWLDAVVSGPNAAPDPSAWVTAVATAVAAFGTVGTLSLALLQLELERRRRVGESREQQSRRISAWVSKLDIPLEPDLPFDSDRHRTTIALLNRSDEPVYNAVVTIVAIQGTAPHRGEDWKSFEHGGPRIPVGVIPPGRWRTWFDGVRFGSPMFTRWVAEIAFTDRAGVHWVRRGTGELEELPENALQYFSKFGFSGPYDLKIAEPDE